MSKVPSIAHFLNGEFDRYIDFMSDCALDGQECPEFNLWLDLQHFGEHFK